MNEDLRTADAAETATRDEWFARIEEIGEELGYFQRLGARHSAFFADEAPTLLVTFETVADIRTGSAEKLPAGLLLARAHGWSHLCLIAEGETWYRDPAVFAYFDRLVDDAFFEDFDNVVFYGSDMGAYAATAYSVTAPGATVIAVRPTATLDPMITEWDKRHSSLRRLDFTSRYGYAPDMIEGAGEVFVIYDPEETLDAMQAALFTKPFVTKLRCRNLGALLEPTLEKMGILSAVIAAAGNSEFTADTFWRLLRARRDHGPYLRTLLTKLDTARRPLLTALLCRNVSGRMAAPRFKRRLAELQDELDALGTELPAPAAPRA